MIKQNKIITMNQDYNLFLYELKNIENTNNHIQNMTKYFLGCNDNYLNNLCHGYELIPTPITIEKFYEHYKHPLNLYPEVINLIDEVKRYSREFYNYVIDLVNYSQAHRINFAEEFERTLHNLGQKIVNHIKLIRYNFDLYRIRLNLYDSSYLLHPKDTKKPKPNLLTRLIYKFNRYNINSPKSSYALYVLISIGLMFGLGGVGYYCCGNAHSIFRSLFSIFYASTLGMVIAIANYKVDLFEYKDICGVNLLASNYQETLGSILNKIRTEQQFFKHKLPLYNNALNVVNNKYLPTIYYSTTGNKSEKFA